MGSHGRESFRAAGLNQKNLKKGGPEAMKDTFLGGFLLVWVQVWIVFLRFKCGSLEDVINYCLLGLKKLSGIDS